MTVLYRPARQPAPPHRCWLPEEPVGDVLCAVDPELPADFGREQFARPGTVWECANCGATYAARRRVGAGVPGWHPEGSWSRLRRRLRHK